MEYYRHFSQWLRFYHFGLLEVYPIHAFVFLALEDVHQRYTPLPVFISEL